MQLPKIDCDTSLSKTLFSYLKFLTSAIGSLDHIVLSLYISTIYCYTNEIL